MIAPNGTRYAWYFLLQLNTLCFGSLGVDNREHYILCASSLVCSPSMHRSCSMMADEKEQVLTTSVVVLLPPSCFPWLTVCSFPLVLLVITYCNCNCVEHLCIQCACVLQDSYGHFQETRIYPV